jgi:hypothetical protein
VRFVPNADAARSTLGTLDPARFAVVEAPARALTSAGSRSDPELSGRFLSGTLFGAGGMSAAHRYPVFSGMGGGHRWARGRCDSRRLRFKRCFCSGRRTRAHPPVPLALVPTGGDGEPDHRGGLRGNHAAIPFHFTARDYLSESFRTTARRYPAAAMRCSAMLAAFST